MARLGGRAYPRSSASSIADAAAHEIAHAPLTALAPCSCRLAERGARDADETRESARRLLYERHRAARTHLVEQLLYARRAADPEGPPPPGWSQGRISPSSRTGVVAPRTAAEAGKRKRAWRCMRMSPRPIVVEGEPRARAAPRMMDNLVDKRGAPYGRGKRSRCAARREGGTRAVFEVEDSGPGIFRPRSARPRVFASASYRGRVPRPGGRQRLGARDRAGASSSATAEKIELLEKPPAGTASGCG